MVEGDAHGGGFGAALGFHGRCKVKGAASVAFVDLVHDLMKGDTPRVIFFGKE